MPKTYNRAYFDRWYRGEHRVNDPAEVRRKVELAIATAEYFLRRRVGSVLDVGCGEGAWRAHLRKLRPSVRYTGVDPSPYAARRFGRSRNIRQGSVGALSELNLEPVFDLVVCSDVLHYIDDVSIQHGVGELASLCRGVAYLEVLTREDDVVGDLDGFIDRPAAWYRSLFRRAGLVSVGPYCWLAEALQEDASALQRC